MYARIFTLLLAVTSLASAAPSRRGTKQISCDDPSAAGRKLKLQTHSNETLAYTAFNGQRDGQGRQNLVTLNPDGSPSDGSHFIFKPCVSDYMGYENNATGVQVGLLYWASSPQHCVTISEVKGENARFVNAKCSYDDDESQVGQTWGTSFDGSKVHLIGDAKGSNNGYYHLTIGDTEHKKVQADWREGTPDIYTENILAFDQ